jgi:hypothetical protein
MDNTLADYDTLSINLIMRKDIGGLKAEQLVFNTKASVRSSVSMQSGSAFDNNLLQINNFASAPSSLVQPFIKRRLPN